MKKIASPHELQTELRNLLAYAQSEEPSREKIATELRELADRLAGNKTASFEVLDLILDQNKLGDVYSNLMMEDEQSAELLRDSVDKLNAMLKLSSGGQEALGRLRTIVEEGSHWRVDLLRNNVFKVAAALGLRLPSGMF